MVTNTASRQKGRSIRTVARDMGSVPPCIRAHKGRIRSISMVFAPRILPAVMAGLRLMMALLKTKMN